MLFIYSNKNHRFHPDSDCFRGSRRRSAAVRGLSQNNSKAQKHKKSSHEAKEHAEWQKEP